MTSIPFSHTSQPSPRPSVGDSPLSDKAGCRAPAGLSPSFNDPRYSSGCHSARFHRHLKLVVVLRPVGVLAVATVSRPPRGLRRRHSTVLDRPTAERWRYGRPAPSPCVIGCRIAQPFSAQGIFAGRRSGPERWKHPARCSWLKNPWVLLAKSPRVYNRVRRLSLYVALFVANAHQMDKQDGPRT